MPSLGTFLQKRSIVGRPVRTLGKQSAVMVWNLGTAGPVPGPHLAIEPPDMGHPRSGFRCGPPAYRSRQFRHACQQMAVKHSRTRPYTPRTNWKGGTVYPDRAQRMGLCQTLERLRAKRRSPAALTDYYNHQRPHGSLSYKPPVSRSDTGTTS
jgi:hypothetical protein